MKISKKLNAGQAGFTLVETMVSILILGGGLLALATALSQGMVIMGTAHSHQIAKQKATEAMENVFTARDARKIAQWNSLQNFSRGGIFLDDLRPLGNPGPDGLINTTDDNLTDIEVDHQTGPDGQMDTADDVYHTLNNFQRQILITDLSPNLRQIQVIIVYNIGSLQRRYVLTAYISPFA